MELGLGLGVRVLVHGYGGEGVAVWLWVSNCGCGLWYVCARAGASGRHRLYLSSVSVSKPEFGTYSLQDAACRMQHAEGAVHA